ncbi:hypothetical protein P691DRAFT_855964 [Macrolepiota fuliginosa MF-IS2]|uniref:Uncharacterized protein n=1 Tax=Macrolepiota fuliginosa MF-IS2 TaxID=1400762 RepID=A0A9P5XCP0_9AGAR|nr:hypothetical protein P691DRAFT_855964 [Macrolepiota fuliginosa MF-IS2]
MDGADSWPITAAQLSGNFCETLFYGIYLVTFCSCVHTLSTTGSGLEERWRRPSEIRWMMTSVAVVLFAICTFDVAIGLLHNFRTFIDSSDPTQVFLNIADWITIARGVNQVTAMILGDFVLIYRCWVVYGRRWLTIAPSLILFFGGISVAVRLINIGVEPTTQRTIALNSNQVLAWGMAFFAITAMQNVLTTSILVWRIWRVEKESEKFIYSGPAMVHQPRHLRRVMRVIAESGAVYSMMVFTTFLVGVIRSNALYPASDMTLQAAGIAFNVILIRSSARRDQQFTAFGHNERTMIAEQRRSDSVPLEPTNSVPGQSRGQDVVLDVKAINNVDNASQSSIYPTGMTVTKTVMTP